MKKKMVGILVSMLLIATALPVVGTINRIEPRFEKVNITDYKEDLIVSDGDWWPMFRHDPGNTGCSSSIGPSSNLLSWKLNIMEDIYSSSPVIVEDKIYLSTGWWYYDIIDPPNITKTFMFEKPSLSKILKDITSYNEKYSGGIYCLDADIGTKLWDYPLYAPNDPAVIDGKVYITESEYYSDDSSLYCLDAETGTKIWQKPIGNIILTPTIIANDKIYLGNLNLFSYSSSLICLDINGDNKWTYPLPTWEIFWFTSPAVYNGRVYFISTNMYSYSGKLYCLDAETGQYLWSHPISSWFWIFGSSSPVCYNGKVYAMDMDLYSYFGGLICRDAVTGNLLWEYDLGNAFSFSTPAVCQDGVYITTFDFYTYNSWLDRINPENGTLIWEAPIPGFAYWFSYSSPICSNYKVFVSPMEYYGDSSILYCYDKEDGSRLWDYDLAYQSLTAPSVADERVYIADYRGNIYAFEDELKIGKISGGLLGVKAEIMNTGESDFMDVTWTISIQGGIFDMVDYYKEGTIPLLQSGDTKKVRAFPVFGLGKVEIETTVTMPGLNVIKKSNEGIALGPFFIVTS